MPQLTVPDVAPEIEYSADTNDTGPYVVPFVFFDQADVFVSLIDSVGNVTELVQTTDWSFTTITNPTDGQGYYSNAEITLGAGEVFEDGMTVRIYRSTVIDRLVNYPFSGPISITSLNDELNEHVMIMQGLLRQKQTYLYLPESAGDGTAWDLSGRPAGSAGESTSDTALVTNRQMDASGPNHLADDDGETAVGVNGQWNTIYSASGIVIEGTEAADGSRTFDLLTQFFGFLQNRAGAEASFYVRYRYQVDCYAQVTKIANISYPVKVAATSTIPFSFMDIAQDIDYTNGNCTLSVGLDIYPLDADSAQLYIQWGNLAVNTSEPR